MGEHKPDVVNDFDAWAAVAARLEGCNDDEYATILAELGISEVWDNAHEAWSKALAGDILEMRLERVQRYGATCARELAARQHNAATGSERDFRHSATFGSDKGEPSTAAEVRQIGGTPFCDDPLDRVPTKKMRTSELEAHLATITEVSPMPRPEPEDADD